MATLSPVRHFGQLIRRYLRSLVSNHDSLKENYILFNQIECIHPIHCDRVLKSSFMLQEPVQHICELLEQPDEMPQALLPLRYKPLVTLRHIDEQLYALKDSVIFLRSRCLRPSQRTRKCREEVQQVLKIVLREEAKAEGQIQIMLETALFQERRDEIEA